MKKILSLLVLSFAMVTLYAQSPANRLSKTIVADVLAQMPSQNADNYSAMMNDLISSGEEGILSLTDMIAPPGQGDNTKVSFAIGGLAYYVSADDKEKERQLVTKAFTKALDKSNDRETKAFLIRMLQITGKNDVIETMKKYALSENLYEEAINALSYINSPASKAAIVEIEPKIKNKELIAQVVGERNITGLTPLLIEWYKSDDIKLRRAVTHALSKTTDKKAFSVLAKAADAINYDYDALETTAAFLNALAIQPYSVSKKYISALKKSENRPNVRSQAVAIELKANSDESTEIVLDAMEDDNRFYRNNVLALTCFCDKNDLSNELIKNFNNYDTQTQNDIVNWFRINKIGNAVQAVIPCLTSDDKNLRVDAMNYMIGNNSSSAMDAMMQLLKSDNSEITTDLRNALLWNDYKGFNQSHFNLIQNASKPGKIAALEYLASRKIPAMMPFIEQNRTSSDAELQTLAYKAMINCSTKDDLNKLFNLLSTIDSKNLAYVQKAIGLQLETMSPSIALNHIGNNLSKMSKDRVIALYAYVPTKETVNTLRSLYINESGDAQTAAAAALVAWSNVDALDDIFVIAKDSKMSSLQSDAVSNSVKLISKSTLADAQKFLNLRRLMDITKDVELQKQIINAIGNCNSFNALIYVAPYMDNSALAQNAALAVYKIALKDTDYNNYGPNVEKILKHFNEIRTGGDAGYERQAVNDYLSAAPKGAAGFVSLFNGKDLSGWKGLVKNPIERAKMSEKELAAAQIKADQIMRSGWVIKDGELHFTGKGDNLCTDKKYGDFEMFVDWKIYYNEEYSKLDGDAGIYLRGTPQVQMWDTCRVDVGAEVGSGGLYNNSKNPSKPTLLADNKIGEWNNFHIKMVGERVTVYLNGQLVVDNVILENYWDRSIPIFTEEQIELQAHGSLVAYRDIYVKELEKIEPIKLSSEEEKDGFELLFDGVSMNEWQGNTKDYVAENGTITLYPKNKGGGNLYTKKEYGDFVLRFEFQLTDAANNGLGIRTPLEGDAAYVGMELQILDNEHPVYKDLKKYQYHGSVYGVIPSKRGFLKPVGEWNVQEVIADGDNIKVTLNGEVILEGNIREASKGGEATMDGYKHPGLLNEKGHIAFLGHGSKVSFRNIRVKEL